MAVTQRKRTVVNSARKNAGRRRKLSPAQIAAGFGGKRRQSAQHHRPKRKTKKNKARSSHRPRTKTRTVVKTVIRRVARRAKARKNLGKIISFSLPKESSVATTKRNKSRRKYSASAHHRRRTKPNTGHRRRTRRNPGMGDITGLATNAVFTIAGAVGSKYLTQMVLTTSNTGIMGYLGNIVSAFLLSWGVKAFMKNERAAAAVLSGGFVQVVLRLIADYTPFGQYTSNLGMGDYLAQAFVTPQRIDYRTHSAALLPPGQMGRGMSGCSLYTGGRGLYAA